MNLLTKYIIALTNLYGMVSKEKIVEVYNLHNKEHITSSDVNKHFYLDWRLSENFVFNHKNYFVHETIYIFDKFKETLREKANKPFYIPSKEKLLKYSDMNYFEKSEYYFTLQDLLKKELQNEPEEDLDGLLMDIHYECTNNLDIPAVIEQIQRRGMILDDEKKLFDLTKLLINFANNTRSWSNNGFTPSEINEMEKLNISETSNNTEEMNLLIDELVLKIKNIGRNDPCPCGSGKKYKKCCINLTDNEIINNYFKLRADKSFEKNWKTYEELNAMPTEQIIQKLAQLGVEFKLEEFLKDIDIYHVSFRIKDMWYELYKSSDNYNKEHADENFFYLASEILWERLAPESNMSVRKIAQLFFDGVIFITKSNDSMAYKLWSKAWEGMKYRQSLLDDTLSEFENMSKTDVDFYNSILDFFILLYKLGEKEERYIKELIRNCEDFIELFPHENEFLIININRKLADAHYLLGNYSEMDQVYLRLTNNYPTNTWTYIFWGDMYLGIEDENSEKARELYEKALMVADNKMDIELINERLENISM